MASRRSPTQEVLSDGTEHSLESNGMKTLIQVDMWQEYDRKVGKLANAVVNVNDVIASQCYQTLTLKNEDHYVHTRNMFTPRSSHHNDYFPFFFIRPLFSATVSLFVTESYKSCRADRHPAQLGVTTAPRNLEGRAFASTSVSRHSIPFKPGPPAVRVSILCFLSLDSNITWALLWQQGWQRYIDLLGQSRESHRRARVRCAYPFSGIGRFGIVHAVEII